MASLEIILDPCEGKSKGVPCKSRKTVRVRAKDNSIIGEFCSRCGQKAVQDQASLEKEAR